LTDQERAAERVRKGFRDELLKDLDSRELPTMHELFEAWKGTTTEANWHEHWVKLWTSEIDDALARGWVLIRIGHLSKRPIEKGWQLLRSLTREEAIEGTTRLNQNLGVNAGASNLVLVDYDTEDLKLRTKLSMLTLTMRTPHGFQVFTKGPYDEESSRALDGVHHFNTIRRGNMQSLIPVSQTCAIPSKGGNCEHQGPHDPRIRQWVDRSAPVLGFREFVWRLL
jgi:Bifunctional DNA primase/polymerase, N-terminal